MSNRETVNGEEKGERRKEKDDSEL